MAVRDPKAVATAVRPIADRVCTERGLVLWDVTFVREAGRWTLRVACDKAGGIDADELALVSADLSGELDDTDVVPGDHGYVLELTSPGAERKVQGAEQFAVCTGRLVKAVLTDGRTIEGTIGAVDGDGIRIGDELVRAADVTRARLVIEGFGGSKGKK